MILKYIILAIFVFTIQLGAFKTVSAHEVYVLDQTAIHADLKSPPPDFINTILTHIAQFAGWGILVILIILAVFFISISVPLERVLDPILDHLKKYAPHIAQVTLGLALIASGYYRAIFGVELSLGQLFGTYEALVSYTLLAVGFMLTVGIFPRIAAFVTTAFFIGLMVRLNFYIFNYFTYLGEALTIVLFGGAHTLFLNKNVSSFFTKLIVPALHEYKFLILRIFFGISLIYASLYAKFFHGALALDVVSKYDLTRYFPFDPVFLVLGAMLIEIMLGLFFAIGFEIRFASLFFLVFLTMSLVFFGESVWPHIILIGTALSMFAHGYDKYTFSIKLKRGDLDPVL